MRQNAPPGQSTCALCLRIDLASETISAGIIEFTSFAEVAATAIGLLSIPNVGMPSRRAAKFVVPLPQKGSKTSSGARFDQRITPNGKMKRKHCEVWANGVERHQVLMKFAHALTFCA